MTMLAQTLTTEDMENAVQIWEWGKHARTIWFRTKYPEWVRVIVGRRKDEEKDLRRYIGDINPDYFDALDQAISALPAQRWKDILVHLYVNLYSPKVAAKDLGTTTYTVRNERDMALSMLWGGLDS